MKYCSKLPLIFKIIFSLIIAFVGQAEFINAFGEKSNNAQIKILSQEHDIQFPNKLIFRVEGYTKENIQQTTLRYQISSSGIKSYLYSEFVVNPVDGKFSSSAELGTSGSNYIPSGVQIKYFFDIATSDGSTYTTESKDFTYLNPKYNWMSLESDYLTIYWHDIPVENVKMSVEKTKLILRDVSEITGLRTIDPFRAVVINNPREAIETFPNISQTATRDHLYGGFAFKDYDLFIIGGIGVNGLVHEGTHILVAQAIDSPLANIPAWLNEGLAMFFESSNSGRQNTLNRAINKGQLRPLKTMTTVPGKPEDVRIFYAQSQDATKYIIEKYGMEKMSSLLKELNQGTNIDEAVTKIYGFDLTELQKEWENNLLPTFERKLIVDPGTFWTSSLLGGVFVFALISLLVGWIKKKINPQIEDAAEEDNDEIYWY